MNHDELRKMWMQEAGFGEADIITSLRDDPPFSVERETKQLHLVRQANARKPVEVKTTEE